MIPSTAKRQAPPMRGLARRLMQRLSLMLRLGATLCVGLIAALAVLAPQRAWAAQTLELIDGQSAFAKISQKEPTRIVVDGARIVSVTGNIQSEKNPEGEVAVEKDESRGQLFVRPKVKAKPVNLFVSTDKATYTLLLQPTDIPADTVTIRDRNERRDATPGASTGALARAGSRSALVRLLITAMATGAVPDGVDVQESGQAVRLWQEARFTLQQTYRARSLSAEKYLLTNVSSSPMVLAEPEFYTDNVVGVAIENQNLPPGASTNVFIVKERP